jgi:hypothetical protein
VPARALSEMDCALCLPVRDFMLATFDKSCHSAQLTLTLSSKYCIMKNTITVVIIPSKDSGKPVGPRFIASL